MPKDTTIKRLSLLLPLQLWRKLKQRAERERRPLHNQILIELEKAVENEPMPAAEDDSD